MPTGDNERGLGRGEFDYDRRLRTQKTWSWFTALGSVRYRFVTDPEFGGVIASVEIVWFVKVGQDYQIARKTKLRSEIYFVSRGAAGEPNRLAANIGFKHKLQDKFTVHAAIGKSIREGDRGGPDLRVQVGVRWEFAAPGTQRKDQASDEMDKP